MKAISIRRYLAIFTLALLAPFAMAEGGGDAPVKTMASILAGLNHFPNADQKVQLQAIANDADNSEAVKTIAMAMHDMQHAVSADNKAKLQAIAADANADASVKTLAEILAGVNHMPSPDAKAKLNNL
ncbi:MAG: hypothetical protein VR73_05165 [Gammaproteobacteria bacterium BRH_c0]|nr:MAG: hypothetical protein VR73_05165 [Gammaproteobacteria bacterium BRH_c0]